MDETLTAPAPDSASPKSDPGPLLVSFYALLIAAAIFSLSVTVGECDLWGHLRFGLDSLRDGIVTTVDPYSYLTAGTKWVNHEWLAEGALAVAYTAGGPLGIGLMRMGIVVGIFAMILTRLHRSGLPPLCIGAEFLVCLLLLSFGLITARPHLFTYLFFAMEIWILQEAGRDGTKGYRWLIALPVLFALWMNTHGGVLAGLAVLFIYVAASIAGDYRDGRSLTGAFKNRTWWIVASIVSLAAVGITPYGFELLTFLLQTATVPRPEIPEWQPMKVVSVYGIAYFALLFPVVWVMQKRMLREQPGETAVVAACAVLPLLAQRHLPIAAIAMTMLSAPALARELQLNPKLYSRLQLIPRGAKASFSIFMTALFGVTATVMVALTVPKLPHIIVGGQPVAAVQILKSSKVEGNMICFFDWGEYCLFHLGPQVKVSLDGRRETCYNPDVYDKNVRFTYGVHDWDALLKDGNPTMALLSRNTAGYALLKLVPQWRIIHEDDTAALFAKEGSPQYDKLAAPRPPVENLKPVFP